VADFAHTAPARNGPLRTHGYNPTWSNLVCRLKYVRNVWREVGNTIGAGTNYHDPERQYFYVLLELKIAVESYEYFSCAMRAA
jgi:hypothetical protein